MYDLPVEKRALIVDDHPIIRDALVTSLVALEVFKAVETCASFEETRERLAGNSRYDLLILDLSLMDTSGTDGMRYIRENYPEVPVLIFSADDTVETISEAFEAGVHGFVSKSSPVQVVVNAIQLVIAGSTYIPPDAIAMMGFSPPAARPALQAEEQPASVQLSPKQQVVFEQLVQGMPNKVIADRLDIAEGTVKTHVHSIYQALRVRNRAQAILKARQLRLID